MATSLCSQTFPMDFIWHVFPSENHIPCVRAQRKLPSGQSGYLAYSDISGVLAYEIHFPLITSILYNLEMCANCIQASSNHHSPLIMHM